jgi:hypothetical protein
VTVDTAEVGRTRLLCAPLQPQGAELLGTVAPPTPLQIEEKYESIRAANTEGATEVVVTYTYPEMFGLAQVQAVYDADELLQLPGGRVSGVLDLFRDMQVLLADGAIGTICGNPERRHEVPVPPLLYQNGLWSSRVIGLVKHTVDELVEFYWGGQSCLVTPSHPVWSASRRGWVGAYELYFGEHIRVAENVVAPVEGARRITGSVEVFGVEVEYFHNYFVGTGPNAMLVHNGPECFKRMAVEEGLEEGSLSRRGRKAAGRFTEAELNPQHHLFPEQHRPWFESRGIDIDDFTVRLDKLTHDALHAGGGPRRGGGWWNQSIIVELTRQEAVLGRQLTPTEIQAVGVDFLQKRGLGNLPITPYQR